LAGDRRGPSWRFTSRLRRHDHATEGFLLGEFTLFRTLGTRPFERLPLRLLTFTLLIQLSLPLKRFEFLIPPGLFVADLAFLRFELNTRPSLDLLFLAQPLLERP
jgi:hypothetical protein